MGKGLKKGLKGGEGNGKGEGRDGRDGGCLLQTKFTTTPLPQEARVDWTCD